MVKQEVIILDVKSLDEVKAKMKKAGTSNFHVLADFDRTMTYGLNPDGNRTETVISQLRSDSKYLGEDYQKEANRLFSIYHPIEIDPKVSLAEKINKMHEWWKLHFDLIARSGLTTKVIEQVAREKPLRFRKGSLEFLSFLAEKGIPIVFMSAAPGDMILEYLKQNSLLYPNVHVVANRYKFNSRGRVISIQEPIIHTFNKTEITLEGVPVYSELKKRKNVLLLGDSVGDVGMVEGFDYDNLIKVGFLNEEVEKNLELYKDNFDVVLTGDQDFSFVNKLVNALVKK